MLSSTAAAAAALQRLQWTVLKAVRSLVQSSADLEVLLGMLVGLGSADPAEQQPFQGWGWGNHRQDLTSFSDAMRHLQQQHALDAGSLVAMHLGLQSVVYQAMMCRDGLHAIHHWAIGSEGLTLPLPLLRLLGVSVDLPCVFDKDIKDVAMQKLAAAVGSSAPPLALALAQPEKFPRRRCSSGWGL
jgi:hypothetical protein